MLDKSQLSPKLNNNSTLAPDEVAKFDEMAKEWWDPEGKFKTALAFNQERLSWIVPTIAAHANRSVDGPDLSGLRILDVGSGGGLIAESLAILGADVTGIDASAVSVEIARRHAQSSGVAVDYRHMLSDQLVAQGEQFDVVINAEVVEHVPDQPQLIKECCQLVAPGGQLLLATLNRSIKSYIIAILGAEYVMRYLPKGTHDWRLFVKPSELRQWTAQHGLDFVDSTGMQYNPFSQQWRCVSSEAVNYIQAYMKA
ncbi:bifunctional 2-polyprenyl-6-hydroxyphenol methylase/3-demethylubiquinol 3-O-methyltransferase UbiG [Alteromonas sp. ASW11-36]|uniref:Ubiquinone biosynthesis O-methyltransferase n=1 Tax=Alteromonas arenosi TaxID=3055817 RepID=A0ABT7SS66_9ALTE|nr:bifunctional 2-polyprenyl-6-hydroxyphenol methylase/3-demethylubiquinol 3-O-methyltransferase UbiG [Alteromonas sp. ASW11-36]MDM7859031.1 bifunctional 2-polyprenyl-6-hydroxyphenol methylase/3-demethylubiquinol 3-O-methyltransferase UbiG [Alteromonas sp. ASW11-36]